MFITPEVILWKYENVINQKHLLWAFLPSPCRKRIKSSLIFNMKLYLLPAKLCRWLKRIIVGFQSAESLSVAFYFHRYAGTEINTRRKWNAIESIFRIVYAFREQEAEARNSRKNIKHSLMAIWSLLIYYEWTNGMLSEIISAISLLPLSQSAFHQRKKKTS